MEETTTASEFDPKSMHPADIADQLQRMPAEESCEILHQLPRAQAARVLSEIEDESVLEMLGGFTPTQLAGLLKELPPDEVADLTADLEPETRIQVLAGLPSEQSAQVANLLHYDEDTAGGIMSDRFIAFSMDQTVQQCQELLREKGEKVHDDVAYLYVVDEARRLAGVVSLRNLVFSPPGKKVSEVMNREVQCVYVDADQEEIARRFEHYHYLGLPVLEHDGRLVGVVRANDVIEVMREEATEDMQLMVGLSGEERALTPWHKAIRKRLPWLYVNLLTAFLAAAVVGLFENTIELLPVLAVFLSIVAGQGGNAGAQTLTIIIRDMALGEISSGDGRQALMKEVTLGVMNGVAIGLVVGLGGYLWKGSPMLGLVVGLAMFFNLIVAALAGVLIPYGLKSLRVDPALASSIFVTTVTDVAGFFFFLGLATLGIRYFGLGQ